MGSKSRVPMQVSPEFERRIKNLQSEIMKKQGKVISLRELTENITKTSSFDELEKQILNVANMDFKINLDRRGK